MNADCFNIDNMKKAAANLLSLPQTAPALNMTCAAEYESMIGFPVLPGESWGHYTNRILFTPEGQEPHWTADIRVSDAYLWFFDSTWVRFDNTPQGLAKRILYAVEHGVPADFRPAIFSGKYVSFVSLYQNQG